MLDWVKNKLDKIDELYPKAEIEKRKDRISRLWTGKPPLDRYPFTYINFMFCTYNDVHTPEERLKITLDETIVRAALDDDYIPSVFPGCRTASMPTMFGAEEIRMGDDYSAKKIIFSYEDVDKLPEPVLKPGSVAYEWLEFQKKVIDLTDGRIPVHITDMQGPVDVAASLWGYDNLFVAAYERPDYYHKIMGKVTRAFIMFWKAQRDLLGDLFVPTHLFGWNWAPKELGATLSADSLVMVSGEFFDEFYKPYIEEIGRDFGNLCIHSCGDFSQTVKTMKNISCLRGINASEMSIEQLMDAGLDESIVAVTCTGVGSTEDIFDLVRKNSLRVDLSIWLNPVGMAEDEIKRVNDTVIGSAQLRS